MSESLHILIPIYNAAATLGRTMRSLACIVAPHRAVVTVIGIDDGSTDLSAQIFEREMGELNGFQHALIRKDNGGSGSARNKGLGIFSDGWTLFLDADDELVQDPLPYLRSHPENTALLFRLEYYRDNSRLKHGTATIPDKNRFIDQFTSRNLFHPLSVIFRRERVTRLFDEDLVFLEDWHFWAINPGIFSACSTLPSVILGRVHVGVGNKSSDQYNNGKYRIMAAEKIGSFWNEKLGRIGRNNLAIQKAIGRIQMRMGGDGSAFFRLPASPSLYGKLLIYSLLFPVYALLNPYRDRSSSHRG